MARTSGVTRDQVIDAACAIADRDGLSAVGLSPVAAAVGVRPPSLYAHVDGLAGLHRAITRRAIQRLTEAIRTATHEHEDPRAALRAIADAYRAFALAHPGLYASLLPIPRPGTDPEGAVAAAEPVHVIATTLDALGLPSARHVHVVRTFRALLHGFVDLELGGGFGLDEPVEASFDTALDLLIASLDELSTG